jgi:hypothetical protein
MDTDHECWICNKKNIYIGNEHNDNEDCPSCAQLNSIYKTNNPSVQLKTSSYFCHCDVCLYCGENNSTPNNLCGKCYCPTCKRNSGQYGGYVSDTNSDFD